MVRRSQNLVFIMALLAIVSVSCIKEYSIENMGSNQVPNASAGEDIILTTTGNFPGPITSHPDQCIDEIVDKATIHLNASSSSDPDGEIVSYQWNFIANHPSNSGSVPTLENANQAASSVILDQPGEYWFSLTVTDNSGATDTDSIKISNQSNEAVQLLNPVYLGVMKESNVMNMVIAGNKLFIQYQVDSPYNNGWTLSTDKIKTYDFDTKTWSDLALPFYRTVSSMVSSGNKLFFSGGEYELQPANGTNFKVDVYDIITGQWTNFDLPENFQANSSLIVDNKIIFHGRNYQLGGTSPNDLIEILDQDNKTWTSTRMSLPRDYPEKVAVGNQIVFTGGNYQQYADQLIEIFNLENNSWRVSFFYGSSGTPKGIAFENKIYWVNIANYTSMNNPIEVWDMNSGNSEFICFSNGLNNIFAYNHQLLFTRNMSRIIQDKLEFKNIELFKYDPGKNSWTIGRLPNNDKIIGGIGAIIGAPGQQRIIGVGYKEFPNVFWDVGFLYPQFDHEFWEISF